jgi:hypothetical protein
MATRKRLSIECRTCIRHISRVKRNLVQNILGKVVEFERGLPLYMTLCNEHGEKYCGGEESHDRASMVDSGCVGGDGLLMLKDVWAAELSIFRVDGISYGRRTVKGTPIGIGVRVTRHADSLLAE